jgi:hypothetical protein
MISKCCLKIGVLKGLLKEPELTRKNPNTRNRNLSDVMSINELRMTCSSKGHNEKFT